MFRKPREAAQSNSDIKPSTGRPPTPPSGATTSNIACQSAIQPLKSSTRVSSTKLLTGAPIPAARMAASKSTAKSATPNNKRPSTTPRKRFREKQGKPNGSILSFFKKAETQEEDDGGWFLAESQANAALVRKSTRSKAG